MDKRTYREIFERREVCVWLVLMRFSVRQCGLSHTQNLQAEMVSRLLTVLLAVL